MGLLDNMQSALNRGTAAAGRTSKSTRLKMQLNDLTRQRKELAAQLGASIYDAIKDDPSFRRGREDLFDAIARVDAGRTDIEAQLSALEAQAVAAREAALAQAEASRSFACPKCGTRITNGHAFCTGCGTSMAEIRQIMSAAAAPAAGGAAVAAPSTGLVCVSCGAPIQEGDLFCITCGAKQPEKPEGPAQTS